MKNRFAALAVTVVALLTATGAYAQSDQGTPSADQPSADAAGVFDGEISGDLETAELYGVLSMSDDDIEIIGRIEAGDERILAARVLGPTGQVVKRITFADEGLVGQADLQFATPELTLDEMKSAYPAGDYEFRVRTVSGKLLGGVWTLTYDFATAPVLIYPAAGDTGISRQDLVVRWDPVPDAAAIRFEIEDPESEIALKIDLPGTATEFAVPTNWLNASTEYVADVKIIGANKNQIVRDVAFTTGT